MPVRYTPRFAYTANIGSNNISGFSINSSTGALAGIAGSPFPSPSSASPAFIATDPKGTLAYAANFSTNNVSGYAISKASGALTPLASPASAGTAPVAIAVDPTGRFVYTANQASNDTSGFTVNPMTSDLTGIAGSPFSVGLGPSAVTIDPAGRYVFVANGSTANISVLGITATDGVLSAVLGSPFAAGTFPRGLAIVELHQHWQLCAGFQHRSLGRIDARSWLSVRRGSQSGFGGRRTFRKIRLRCRQWGQQHIGLFAQFYLGCLDTNYRFSVHHPEFPYCTDRGWFRKVRSRGP